ncbi:histidinol-phosphate transaminase [Adhaeribacter radiodurans]|uniref:Histidinol-phosphate aminotransferase n=1 Tax=Adhaeribacter radiodurans TaxID=2745197 RepID=A0A7L7L6H4_9BACT|nr:histidinol-phosphate transaminase [Adhaeribacter radiodurans]QMU28436.1 histidinol-phosphate transaminase [Adhaeribacter radiodurans]
MFKLTNLVRPNIRGMKPYSSARDEFEGEASIFVDANENNLGSMAANQHYNRYPDPHQKELKAAIAQIKGVKPEQIFLGNGSDEAIDLLIRLVCQPGHDQILAFSPTYGMYEVSANLNDVELKLVRLDENFQLQLNKLQGQIHSEIKIIFICTPNNPSGNLINRSSIEYILQSFSGLVVIDEAYIDFSSEDSWLTQLSTYPNLVVLQTFSKAWGMAALRLGMAFASEEVISFLNKIKPPYNINEATQQIALEALQNSARLPEMVKEIKESREILVKALKHLPVVKKVYPSDANFILVEVTDANAVYAYLLNNGIVVRNRTTQPGCFNCLRISVGTKSENGKLVTCLKNYI